MTYLLKIVCMHVVGCCKRKVIPVHDDQLAKICANIANNRAASTIAKSIMKSRLREAVVTEVLSAVDDECRLICRKHQSCLQQTGITDLQDISFHEIIEEWQQLAPLFLSILQTILKVLKKNRRQIRDLDWVFRLFSSLW